ncbi:MAG TPA: nucleotidyltransferase family protein [Gaiella sp.]|nr:nucleotidyltransferase family protein [Gaiella sp.]
MGSQPNDAFLELVETMKRSAATLRDAKVPVLLGGGLASWARGGPPTDHDVDFLVRERDIERAEEALAAAGFRLERPPEGWLVKAWDGDVLVDLIFHPAGGAVGDEHFERATTLEVAAQPLPVASVEDVLTTKLLALTEQEPDFGPVLEIARSLREQIDWVALRSQVERSPFGAAFFTLVERLGIVEEPVAIEVRG